MRERVKVQILDAVRRDGGISSKKSIQASTGLAWGTVCKNVDAMIDEGILAFHRSSPTGRGRPTGRLMFHPESGFLGGFDLSGDHWRVLFADLMFRSLFERTVPAAEWEDGESFCREVVKFIRDSLAESGLPVSQLRGIGVGVSGNIDSERGVLVSAGNLGLKRGTDLKLRDRLEKEFGVDCFLTTSRAAAAWAEYHFGPYAGTGNLIVVGIGVGIGAAIISEHTLLPNRPDRPTGYIGHLYLPGIQRKCVCGELGCIEAFAGGRSLASLAQERFPGQTIDAAQLDRLAEEGNREARELIGRAADYDAFAVAFLLQMYHPDALIFYGGECRKEGFLYNELLRRLDFHVPPARRGGMSISISGLGERHVALGAARLYFEKLF